MKCCCGICGDFLEGGLIVNSIVRQMRPSDIFINQSNHCVLLWNVFVLSAHQFQYRCVPNDKCGQQKAILVVLILGYLELWCSTISELIAMCNAKSIHEKMLKKKRKRSNT